MRVLVTGGAGFLGSHLIDALLRRGDQVVVADNLSTSDGSNLAWARGQPGLMEVLRADVCDLRPAHWPPTPSRRLTAVAALASPASPDDYTRLPLETLRAGSAGTDAACRIAAAHGARLVLASTSEVYGDPEVCPQRENYRGSVDPVGPRSCYDEAKRYAEALAAAWARTGRLDVGIARVFNTYGPRLRPGDGRVVSSFVAAALTGRPLVVHGDGEQTRSLCYVDDTVDGLLRLLGAPGFRGPVNLGSPHEGTINDLARCVLALADSTAPVEHAPARPDDPRRRCPDVTLAREALGWRPTIPLREGVSRTVAWFRTTRVDTASVSR